MFDELIVHINNIFFVFESLTSENGFWWGVGIIVLYPLLLIIITELTHRLNKENSEFLSLIVHVRNIVLPILLLYLLLAKILILPESHLALKIIKSLFWILLISFILKTVNAILFSETFKFQERMPKLLVDFIRAFLVLFGIALVAADVWGADLGNLLAALGMGSLVLGLALQDVLGGLFSGIALLSSRPFIVGDWIRVGEVEGQVKSIDWRAVSLQTKDKSLVTIPNAVIAQTEFENFSKPTPLHRISVNIDFLLEHPPNQVILVLLKMLKNMPGVLKNPEPDVLLSSYNAGAFACYEIRCFISHYEKKDETYKLLMSQIWYTSQREKIYLNPKQLNRPSLSTDKLLEKLKMLNVFDVRDDDFMQLAQNAQIENYGMQELILTENLPSMRFYIVVEGIAEQRHEVTHNQQTATYRLTTGEFFGFSGMVSNENGGESVVAITDLTVIAIKMEAIRRMLQRNPQIADCLEKVISSRNALL